MSLILCLKAFIRVYKHYHGGDQHEAVFRELENLKNTTKEIKMYLSVLANMIASGNESIFDNISKEEDRKIAQILIGAQNRVNLKKYKDQEINILNVFFYFLKGLEL